MRFLIVFCSLIVISFAGEAKDKKPEVKCQGLVISLSKEMESVSKTCNTKIFGELKRDDKEDYKTFYENKVEPKKGCAHVCYAKALKLVKDNGKVDKDNMVKFVEKLVNNKDVSSKIIAGVDKCVITTTANVPFKEDTCLASNENIMNFVYCVDESTKKVCGIKEE